MNTIILDEVYDPELWSDTVRILSSKKFRAQIDDGSSCSSGFVDSGSGSNGFVDCHSILRFDPADTEFSDNKSDDLEVFVGGSGKSEDGRSDSLDSNWFMRSSDDVETNRDLPSTSFHIERCVPVVALRKCSKMDTRSSESSGFSNEIIERSLDTLSSFEYNNRTIPVDEAIGSNTDQGFVSDFLKSNARSSVVTNPLYFEHENDDQDNLHTLSEYPNGRQTNLIMPLNHQTNVVMPSKHQTNVVMSSEHQTNVVMSSKPETNLTMPLNNLTTLDIPLKHQTEPQVPSNVVPKTWSNEGSSSNRVACGRNVCCCCRNICCCHSGCVLPKVI